MIAPGNHWDFYSLRGAPPPGEGFGDALSGANQRFAPPLPKGEARGCGGGKGCAPSSVTTKIFPQKWGNFGENTIVSLTSVGK